MNTCYTEMLFKHQKDENRKKEEEERLRQISEQRKQDLLRGNPFKLSYMDRAKGKKQPDVPSPLKSTASQPVLAKNSAQALNFKGVRHGRPFINHASPPRKSTKTPKHLILLNKPFSEDDGLGNFLANNIHPMEIIDENKHVDAIKGDASDKAPLPEISSNRDYEDNKHAVHQRTRTLP